MQYDIEQADILQWAATYDGEPFHAALMDAPYEMEFMGKGWDDSGVSFRAETWEAIARHLYPGAFLFVFAGTLNDDLISVAMRNAGLRRYHKALAWSYGSGFPKAARLDTVIDRRAGADRATVGTRKHQPKFDAAGHGYRLKDNGYNSKERATFDVTAPATALAADWAGHRYGGQFLKPAIEPLLIFQKPVTGDMVSSIARTGAGAINVDGGRIAGEKADGSGSLAAWRDKEARTDVPIWTRKNKPGQNGSFNASGGENAGSSGGRWPANFALSHHPDCTQDGTRRVPSPGLRGDNNNKQVEYTKGLYGGTIGTKQGKGYADADGYETILNWHCHEACPVRRLGEQSGEQRDGVATRRNSADKQDGGIYKGGFTHDAEDVTYGSTGTAARFFHAADFIAERLEESDPVGYYAKASRSEREFGLDDMQARMMRALYGTDDGFEEDTIDDGRPTPIDNPYQRGKTERKNIHPTIKPIALNRWLATLLLPPERYGPRRLLVPFAGVASEMIGAMLAGWEVVQGVELEETHVAIARARIAFWKQMRYKLTNPDAPVKIVNGTPVPDGQTTLW